MELKFIGYKSHPIKLVNIEYYMCFADYSFIIIIYLVSYDPDFNGIKVYRI